MAELREESHPIDLLNLAKLGGDALSVQRTIGPILNEEKEFLLRILGGLSDGSAAQYAFLSGSLRMVQRIERLLSDRIEEGREAQELLTENTRRQ